MDTIETIPNGVGFTHFGSLHLCWIIAGTVLVILNCIWYRRADRRQRKLWRFVVAGLIVMDELFKVVMLCVGGRYNLSYLPLHLCSINIFLIGIHAFKSYDILSGFLYTVCLPGALSAILFPSWTSLPFGNFMHIHSFTIHILLVMYPVVIVTSGEWKPYIRKMYRYFLLLVALAIPVCFINILLDTNFMFLMDVDPGNPLYYFETIWGNHLWGFPVLISAVLIALYVPVEIFRYLRRKKI